MTKQLRPFLTLILTFGLFGSTTYFVTSGAIKGDIYLTTWIQMVGMMVAFYFGERSALKTPGDPEK